MSSMIRNKARAATLIAAAVALVAMPAAAGEVATISALGSGVAWSPQVEYQGLVLTVSGGDVFVRQEFGPSESPSFDTAGLPDGTYRWELRVLPRARDLRTEEFTTGKVAPNGAVVEQARAPRGLAESGAFTILNGAVVDPGAVESSAGERSRSVRGTRISGDLVATGAKSFVAPDPANRERAIYYAALEGPEAGTYFRGNARIVDGRAVIELPEHFAKVTETEGLTVQLTPLGAWSRLYVAETSPRRLVVMSADAAVGEGAEFSFLVQGVRKGYENFEVERPSAAIGSD